MSLQFGKRNNSAKLIYNCFKTVLLPELPIRKRETKALIMMTEELKGYCMSKIKVDGSSEDIVSKFIMMALASY